VNNSVSPAMPLLVGLQRFRSRALRVTFVRYAITAGASALIAIAAVVLLIRPSAGTQLTLLLIAGGSGLIGAGVAAFVRRPGLRQTAALVDGRCHLDNCLTTAVQFAGDADPVSHLVVEQALARLARLTPAEAFPYEWRVPARALTAGAIGAVLVIGVAGVKRFPNWSGVPIIGGPSRAPATSDGGDAPTRHANDSQGPTHAVTAGSAGIAVERLNPASALAQPLTESSASGGRSSETSDPAQPAAAAEGTRSTSDREAVAATAAGPANTVNSRGADHNPSSGPSSSTGQRGGSGAGAGREVRSSSGAAGGVSGGQVTGQRDAAARERQLADDYASRYRKAVGRAEEALVREQVPAELRDAVRAYFTAIRP
jgi:hypothetical protein